MCRAGGRVIAPEQRRVDPCAAQSDPEVGVALQARHVEQPRLVECCGRVLGGREGELALAWGKHLQRLVADGHPVEYNEWL